MAGMRHGYSRFGNDPCLRTAFVKTVFEDDMTNQYLQSGALPANAESAFSAFATPLVHEALTHAAKLQTDPDAEGMHALRVAMRRLRSLFWAYRPLLDDAFDDQQRAVCKFIATAAGNTRDWDILVELLRDLGEDELADVYWARRSEAYDSSKETISNARIEGVLTEALKEANQELNTSAQRTPLEKFARKRVTVARLQLKKRMIRATKAKRSDYERYHEVRKAGKKLRYMLEFFGPVLPKKQTKHEKALKQLQKKFGELNDVVASRDLMRLNPPEESSGLNARKALKSLAREERRRHRKAEHLL